jgi:hypothetical protein
MISFTAVDVDRIPANLAVLHAAREALDITDDFLRPNLAVDIIVSRPILQQLMSKAAQRRDALP